MTDCVMYNISMGKGHPSTICVELSRVADSLNFLRDGLSSEYADEYLSDFIAQYARTDEIMPDDRTLGFIIINTSKKAISLALSRIEKEKIVDIVNAAEMYEELGFDLEKDIG
ncbi:MAG: TA0956 family protein [Candidatus Thermoplasmatota archaeon]|nr:TA0956 family protein [Candidatus Thermoplasmatota archaeon]